MTDISAVGTIITFTGQDGLSEVDFKDVSDMDAPISFGEINTLGTEFDLNHNLVVQHKQVTPEFSLSFIPNSTSDNKMRAFLLSSMVGDASNTIRNSVSNIMIETALISVPDHDVVIGGTQTYKVFKFTEGYLVGGSVAIGVNNEGRMASNAYKFVFRDVCLANPSVESGEGGDRFESTALYKNDDAVTGLYYARASASSSARMISHPIESGAVVFDHKFREPSKVELRVKIPQNTASTKEAEFESILNDRTLNSGTSNKTQYWIQTKSKHYENLCLIGFRHEETPDAFDLLEYTLTFQELMFSSASGETKTTDPGMSDSQPTQAKGTQDSRPTT